LKGELPLVDFERLMDVVDGVHGGASVHFHATGSTTSNADGIEQVWLVLTSEVTLQLVCQRCLERASLSLAFQRKFRFVATEAQAALEDEDSDEDVLVIHRSFNLFELIEDELLMALPAVPMHLVCPVPVALKVADAAFKEPELEKPNPFAVLQQLRKTDLT
jgi:uncharacterized protein